MTHAEVRTVRLCRIKPGELPEFLELAADHTLWDTAFERSLIPQHVMLYGLGVVYPELVAEVDAYVNDNGIAEQDPPNRLASLLAAQRIFGTMIVFGPYNHAAELDEDEQSVADEYAGMTSISPEFEHALTPTEGMTVVQVQP